jgi:carboxylesterase
MTSILAGAEPWSHTAAAGAPGVLALHGFTGSPAALRPVAAAFAAAGWHVELPLLPGHGTVIDDMVPTRWADWVAAVDCSRQHLSARTDRIVLVGQSMGATLALWAALATQPSAPVSGLVLVNPVAQPPAPDVRAMILELLADGTAVVPGGGSDIADPDAVELAYDGTPLAALLSLVDDGVVPLTDRYGELSAPLLLFTSRQDHVIDPAQSEHLAATYGGPVDHRWLTRSYHVACADYERDDIVAAALAFAGRVTAR